ncbi:two-component system phosphate regulon sensor histidine kinase PhoR [Lachnotalea glycerini]|uniref:histidine kinase n=1 Tax=Lachnotalea glycerini TaxID=1763509 RepID=A0A318EVG2_9FIRM|nr:ATP-binding protein [Lachnotalea glycerini]PXV93733.1 two-component system phosphate regulon sensor histidine kinase PhoR [Lachnotalea glycerini]
MRQKIFKSMGVLIAASLILSYVLMIGVMYQQLLTNMEKEVQREVTYLRSALDIAGVTYLENEIVKDASNRITLVDQDGTVLFDSMEDIKTLENHKDRPEIMDAFNKGEGTSVRFSTTLGQQTFYYAMKLNNGMIIRVANTTDSVFSMITDSIPMFIILGIIVLGIAMGIARFQTKRIIIPINNLNLETPLENDVYEELTPLLHRIENQNRLIEKQLSKLNKRKEEFNAITENMREALIIINKRSIVLSMNKAATEILDVSREEGLERHFITISRDNEFQTTVEAAMSGVSSDAIIMLNNKYYKIMANPVCVEDTLNGCVILMLDVTEKQRAEQMRKEFSANVSHELKTPLMSISGYAEIMNNGLVKSEDVAEFSGRIYSEATRLTNLVEDIIKLSRLDEDNKVFEQEEVNLLVLAEDIKERLLPQATKKNVELRVLGENVKVKGIRQILDEMLFNLLDNAIKYNEDGGKAGVSVVKENDKVILSVWDTGIGIPKEHQDRIFERFYRVDKSHSRETGGTGLGLSIVKHGAIYHKADIKIDSEVSRGTKIIITFKTI